MSTPDQCVAVIGGGGFIGRRLVPCLLALGTRVRVLGLGHPVAGRAVEWVSCDVRNAGALREALGGTSVIYNLAAVHGLEGVASAAIHEVNVDGALSVCRAAASVRARRIVFTSSAAVYGREGFPDESTIPTPRGPYAVSKLAAEDLYRTWAADGTARSLVIVRPTVVFGPGGNGAGGRLLRHLAGPDFAHVGPAQNHKSLAFVDNLAAFLSFILDGPTGIETYNYADVPDLSLAEIAAIVRAAIGLPQAQRRSRASAWAVNTRAAIVATLSRSPRPSWRTMNATIRHLTRDIRYNAAKAHGTGFRQPVPLREALAATARADARWVAWLSRSRG